MNYHLTINKLYDYDLWLDIVILLDTLKEVGNDG